MHLAIFLTSLMRQFYSDQHFHKLLVISFDLHDKLISAQCPMYKPSVLKKPKEPEVDPNEKLNENEPLDPLAPENHQQLSLLLYSFSNKSANVPDFCVNPWQVLLS